MTVDQNIPELLHAENPRHVVLRMRTTYSSFNRHVEGEGAFRDSCIVSACVLCKKHENDTLC